MIDRGGDLGADSRNLFFENGDAGVELFDRKRIEILADEQGQRILGLVGEEFVEIHRGEILPGAASCQPAATRQALRRRAFPASVAR